MPFVSIGSNRQHCQQSDEETKGAVNNSRTRAAKTEAQEEYTEANRAVKDSIKTDKANFIEDLAKEAEDTSAQGKNETTV